MHNNRPSAPLAHVSDQDLVIYLLSAPLLLAIASALVVAEWVESLAWMLAHRILLPASAHPLVLVPYAKGAGLDLGRLMIVSGALLILLAVLVVAVKPCIARLRAEQREEAQ